VRFATSLDHARTGRSVSILSLIGIILVPLAIAGTLVWSFWDPQSRVSQVTAAVVNNDEPVTIHGRIVPLGRQLAAGLVGTEDENYTWVVTNEEDAASGLADGAYTAVVTIPEDFSAKATSATGDAPAQADVTVVTSDRAKLVDGAISQAIATAAVSIFNREVTVATVEQLLGGYTELHDSLADAATGANDLASGTGQFASGVVTLSGGLGTLATGAAALSSGLGELASGTASLPAQSAQLATGADGVATGVESTTSAISGLSQQAQYLQGLCAGMIPPVNPGDTCDSVRASLATNLAALDQQLTSTGFAANARAVATGTAGLASGLATVVPGIQSSASGAASLADGAAQSASGASQLASGATGLTDGSRQLADGLDEAVAAIPVTTEDEAAAQAQAIAEPTVLTSPGGLFGSSAAPLAAGLALWLGALATFLVLRPVPRDAVGANRGPVRQALGAFLPAAIVGLVQSMLVATVLQLQLDLDAGGLVALFAAAALASVAFAAVNQALVALFDGAGRFVAMLVAILFLATGVISTTPPVLVAIANLLPVEPAASLIAAVVGGGGVASAIVVLVVWTLLALAGTTLAIARARVTTARAVLRDQHALVA